MFKDHSSKFQGSRTEKANRFFSILSNPSCIVSISVSISMKAETNETWSFTAFSRSKIDLKRLQDSKAQWWQEAQILNYLHYLAAWLSLTIANTSPDKDKLNHSVWKSGLSSIIHVHIHMIIIRKAQTETKKKISLFFKVFSGKGIIKLN